VRTTLFVALTFTSFVGLWAQDKIQPMDVKPGLWQVTMTTTMAGQVPADLLQKLTPEQRAKFEERMAARSGEPNKPMTYKSCITQEQINKGYSFAEDRHSCTSTVVSSSRSKEDVRLECSENGMKLNGTVHLERIDSEDVKAQLESVGTDGERTIHSNATLAGKWLGSDCGTTK